MDEPSEVSRRISELAASRQTQAPGDTSPESQLLEVNNLNWIMEKLPVSVLPASHLGSVVDVRSDASLDEALRQLSEHGILSAPVRDVAAAEDASWMDRYTGVVDFPGIVLWVLNHQSVQALRTPRVSSGAPPPQWPPEGEGEPLKEDASEGDLQGDLFSILESSADLRSTKVSDITGAFRWAPFLPLTQEDTMLTLLLVVAAYRARVVPIVEPGLGPLPNFVTQSTVAHFLAHCAKHPAFGALACKPISELGLPNVTGDKLVKVSESDPVLEPFRLMQRKGIGGVPVVKQGSNEIVGSISVRDIQLLLLHPRVLRNYRTLTVSEFITLSRKAVPESEATTVQKAALTITSSMTVGDLLQHLDKAHTPRAYVTNAQGDLQGVVTLRDVIGRLVVEPPGYFGDFFQGVVPLTSIAETLSS